MNNPWVFTFESYRCLASNPPMPQPKNKQLKKTKTSQTTNSLSQSKTHVVGLDDSLIPFLTLILSGWGDVIILLHIVSPNCQTKC